MSLHDSQTVNVAPSHNILFKYLEEDILYEWNHFRICKRAKKMLLSDSLGNFIEQVSIRFILYEKWLILLSIMNKSNKKQLEKCNSWSQSSAQEICKAKYKNCTFYYTSKVTGNKQKRLTDLKTISPWSLDLGP